MATNEEYLRNEGYKMGYKWCLYMDRQYKAALLENTSRHYQKGFKVAMRMFLQDKEKELQLYRQDRAEMLRQIKQPKQDKGNFLER